MSDISKRIEALTPEQRELLGQRLKQLQKAEGVKGGQQQQQQIVRRDPNEPAQLSFSQHRLWFVEQLQPGNASYNMPMAVRFNGALNIAALQATLTEIVRRHETLRTTFGGQDGQPLQVIHEAGEVELPVIELSAHPDPEAEALRIAAELSHHPFDLRQGPLLRVSLMRLGADDHIMSVTLHHIISDGWSMAVLVREFMQLYEAFQNGRPSPLPELPIQYADFAAWQRQWLIGDVLDEQLTYWKEQLRGAPPVLELPTDRPRPSVQSFNGRSYRFELPDDVSARLQELSRREGATLFMTLLAAFDVLLWRYTGQTDIVVGSPIAERARVETESMIGFFVNTLVLRTKLDGNPTFVELLKRVRETCLDAYAHQDVPFERLLIEDLDAERTLSHSPLFQVMFIQHPRNSWINLPPLPSGLEMHNLRTECTSAKFDLTFFLEEAPEGLLASIEYNTDLFDEDTIKRMAGHFRQLVSAIAAHPAQRIADLPLLTSEERDHLISQWNQTEKEYEGADRCIHELIAEQAARTPDALALISEAQRLSYGELNSRANQLAHYLRSRGVKAETPVAVMLERSTTLIVTLLGILKAGGAYVPLDPAYPQERLRWMMQDTNAPLIITQQELAVRVPEGNGEVVLIDEQWAEIGRESEEEPAWKNSSEQLAYIIYTSGSTGKPKGVMVSHRSLVNYIKVACEEYRISAGERVLQFSSVSFDASAEEIYPALTQGATLVLRSDSMLGTIPLFLRKCREWEINVLSFTTAFWHEMTARMESEGLALPASIRTVLIGGEKALHQRVKLWKQLVGESVRLVNTYGPTEATVVAIVYDTAGEPDATWNEVPIGRPISNVRAYILDREIKPVPVGVTGELYLGGVGVARGYLGRPDSTAEQFVPDPFSGEAGARLYRTGDLARYLSGGVIEFLGRVDNQVKIRGFRIELGEIEAALNNHTSVAEAVVIAREDTPGDRRLVAYVVAGSEGEPSTIELRRYLEERLASYMVPSAWVMLDALPLTPSGKVDHRALTAPEQVRSVSEAYVAPCNAMEETLAGIWQEVLGLERIGVHDSFFDLGGHSLIATQIIARIEDALHLELPLRKLFETPTIAEIAVALAEMQETAEADMTTAPTLAGLESLPDNLLGEPYLEGVAVGQEPLAE